MGSIAYQGQTSLVIVPCVRDPIAYISFVDLRVIGHPHESRSRRISESFRLVLDQCEPLLVGQTVVHLTSPRHSHVEDPRLGVFWSVGHRRNCAMYPRQSRMPETIDRKTQLTRLECMERLLAQSQVACWVLLSNKESLFGIIIAHGHIGVEDLELCCRRIFNIADSYLTQLGPRTIRSNNHAAVHTCAVGEMCDDPNIIVREDYIAEQFAILFHCC